MRNFSVLFRVREEVALDLWDVHGPPLAARLLGLVLRRRDDADLELVRFEILSVDGRDCFDGQLHANTKTPMSALSSLIPI